MKVVVTGAGGLLGRHVQIHLCALEPYRDGVVPVDRAAFNDDASLAQAIVGADAVVHCAGVNRDADEVVEQGNRTIAEQLVSVLRESEATPHVFYANSTQRERDNAYGRGKRAAHNALETWAKGCGARYTELVLPHIFGENGRPFYNSVVFTFCRQIVDGGSLSVNAQGMVELVHAQDVAAAIVDAYERGHSGELRVNGRPISVAEVAGSLTAMYQSYSMGIIPDLRERFDLQLFNTLRSFIYPTFYPKALDLHRDDRGTLFEAVKNRNGGQAFLSTTKPGITRGNHYHFNKVERFLVVRGQAVIRIRRLLDDHVEEFHVSGDAPAYVDVPTLHTHSITNTGDGELMTLFWSHDIFDPGQPDTYFEPVLRGMD